MLEPETSSAHERLSFRAARALRIFRGDPRQTQWNVGMGGAVGLNYEGIEADLRLSRIEIEPETWRLVKVCESEALAVFAERERERQAAREAEQAHRRRGGS